MVLRSLGMRMGSLETIGGANAAPGVIFFTSVRNIGKSPYIPCNKGVRFLRMLTIGSNGDGNDQHVAMLVPPPQLPASWGEHGPFYTRCWHYQVTSCWQETCRTSRASKPQSPGAQVISRWHPVETCSYMQVPNAVPTVSTVSTPVEGGAEELPSGPEVFRDGQHPFEHGLCGDELHSGCPGPRAQRHTEASPRGPARPDVTNRFACIISCCNYAPTKLS